MHSLVILGGAFFMSNIVVYQKPLTTLLHITKNNKYLFNSICMTNQLDKAIKTKDYLKYKRDCDIPLTAQDVKRYFAHQDSINEFSGSILEKSINNINRSRYARKTRLNRFIEALLNYTDCIWVTLTFTDETFSKCSQETLKKYVKNFLSAHSDFYIANVDYGGINGRLHYHAIIGCQDLNLENWHKYGAIKVARIHKGKYCAEKLSKYISKLTNHAIKETCKGNRIIYSKKLRLINLGNSNNSLAENDKALQSGLELFGAHNVRVW